MRALGKQSGCNTLFDFKHTFVNFAGRVRFALLAVAVEIEDLDTVECLSKRVPGSSKRRVRLLLTY